MEYNLDEDQEPKIMKNIFFNQFLIPSSVYLFTNDYILHVTPFDLIKKKTTTDLTLNDVTNMVIDRRRKIVPPSAKNRRRIILLEKQKLIIIKIKSPILFEHTNIYETLISIKM
jgi:hypothetical protein